MRNVVLVLTLCLFSGAVLAQAAATWEIRKRPNGLCEVARVAAAAGPGSRIAGPYKNRKRAEEELARLRKTPKCKR